MGLERTTALVHQGAPEETHVCVDLSLPLSSCSVISGVGELNEDADRPKAEDDAAAAPELAAGPYPDSPYLLLDVRDRDQYDRCHLISGRD